MGSMSRNKRTCKKAISTQAEKLGLKFDSNFYVEKNEDNLLETVTNWDEIKAEGFQALGADIAAGLNFDGNYVRLFLQQEVLLKDCLLRTSPAGQGAYARDFLSISSAFRVQNAPYTPL